MMKANIGSVIEQNLLDGIAIAPILKNEGYL